VTGLFLIALVVGTALLTTAMVEAVCGAAYVVRWVFQPTVPPYNWSSALFASGVASVVVLLASLFVVLFIRRTQEAEPVGISAEERTGDDLRSQDILATDAAGSLRWPTITRPERAVG
jgi:hypothetical protein